MTADLGEDGETISRYRPVQRERACGCGTFPSRVTGRLCARPPLVRSAGLPGGLRAVAGAGAARLQVKVGGGSGGGLLIVRSAYQGGVYLRRLGTAAAATLQIDRSLALEVAPHR